MADTGPGRSRLHGRRAAVDAGLRRRVHTLTVVVVTYLELPLAGMPASAPVWPPQFELRRCAVPDPELNRSLYVAVGGSWHWTDKLDWTTEQWRQQVGSPGYETWVLYKDGEITGYFELEPREDSVELVLFGLVPAFIGCGLGRPLLESAITRAADLGRPRMTVNTCTLDHEAALANYLARGFRIVGTRTKVT